MPEINESSVRTGVDEPVPNLPMVIPGTRTDYGGIAEDILHEIGITIAPESARNLCIYTSPEYWAGIVHQTPTEFRRYIKKSKNERFPHSIIEADGTHLAPLDMLADIAREDTSHSIESVVRACGVLGIGIEGTEGKQMARNFARLASPLLYQHADEHAPGKNNYLHELTLDRAAKMSGLNRTTLYDLYVHAWAKGNCPLSPPQRNDGIIRIRYLDLLWLITEQYSEPVSVLGNCGFSVKSREDAVEKLLCAGKQTARGFPRDDKLNYFSAVATIHSPVKISLQTVKKLCEDHRTRSRLRADTKRHLISRAAWFDFIKENGESVFHLTPDEKKAALARFEQ